MYFRPFIGAGPMSLHSKESARNAHLVGTLLEVSGTHWRCLKQIEKATKPPKPRNEPGKSLWERLGEDSC